MSHRKGKLRCAQDPNSNTHSGLHTANKLLTVLLLRVPMCRASVGRHFHEGKAGWSSYTAKWIMPYCELFKRHVRDVTSCMGAWSAYIVIQCL